jgi:hypothetical protein
MIVPDNVRSIQVFLASPGDTEKERNLLPTVIQELNDRIGFSLDVRLDLVRWETHVIPGAGRDAQDVVNQQIGPRDVFIGILWKRLGTPTQRAASGTVEEFERAYRIWQKNSAFKLFFYFNDAAAVPASVVDPDQEAKVSVFRRSLAERGVLFWHYDGTDQFERLVRNHLTRVVLDAGISRPGISRCAQARVLGTLGRPEKRGRAGRYVVLFDEAHGQSTWIGPPPPIIARGYKSVADLTKQLGCDVEIHPEGGCLDASALAGCRAVVLPTGPRGLGRLEPEEIRALEDFIQTGGGVLLLSAYTGDWHHESNFNMVAQPYGPGFNNDVIVPPGAKEENASQQVFKGPSDEEFIVLGEAAPPRPFEPQTAERRAIREVVLRDVVKPIATVSCCSLDVSTGAVSVVVSCSGCSVREPLPLGKGIRIDKYRPGVVGAAPMVAVSTIGRVVAVGGWKTFLNEFVDDVRLDNGLLFTNILRWLMAPKQ